jgi:hypothetical protein
MEEASGFIDTVILLAGVALILLTIMRFSRRRPGRPAPKGQRMATIGILIWLALLGVALYLIFG